MWALERPEAHVYATKAHEILRVSNGEVLTPRARSHD
jgi:hypothetical protein